MKWDGGWTRIRMENRHPRPGAGKRNDFVLVSLREETKNIFDFMKAIYIILLLGEVLLIGLVCVRVCVCVCECVC